MHGLAVKNPQASASPPPRLQRIMDAVDALSKAEAMEETQFSSHYSAFSNWYNVAALGIVKNTMTEAIRSSSFQSSAVFGERTVQSILKESVSSESGTRQRLRFMSLSSTTPLPPEAFPVGSIVLTSVLWGKCCVIGTNVHGRETSKRVLTTTSGIYHQVGGPLRYISTLGPSSCGVLEVSLSPPPGGGNGIMIPHPTLGEGEPNQKDALESLDVSMGYQSVYAIFDDDVNEATDNLTSAKKTNAQVVQRFRSMFLRPEALDEVGGLDQQVSMICRRLLASRSLPFDVAADLGVPHVRGLLLYGPPGCGKTLLARQLAKGLAAVEVRVVSGPEVLNKFVGTSEERVRELFRKAEDAWALKGVSSGLHVIIIDEIDAICRERGSLRGDTSGVRDSVVNQLLAKLDGVQEVGNMLVIGMTNRRELIDPAMLRPGRLEVHVEVGLPTLTGRAAILDIHTARMRSAGLLLESEWEEVRDKLAEAIGGEATGAFIAGLVRTAASYAAERYILPQGNLMHGIDSAPHVRADDFWLALTEVKSTRDSKDGDVLMRTFLQDLDLAEYASFFTAHHIRHQDLPILDHELLKDLGVISVGHRLRIMAAAASLKQP